MGAARWGKPLPVTRNISFFVEVASRHGETWVVAGEPGGSPEFWPRVGEVFDGVVHQHQGGEQVVRLEIEAITATSVTVSGEGGELLESGDILCFGFDS